MFGIVVGERGCTGWYTLWRWATDGIGVPVAANPPAWCRKTRRVTFPGAEAEPGRAAVRPGGARRHPVARRLVVWLVLLLPS